MTDITIGLIRLLTVIAGLSFTSAALSANPLTQEQEAELGKLYQAYVTDSQATLTARKLAEQPQAEIVSRPHRLTVLQGQAERAETELSELQEFDRKKPGKVKPEELEMARNKHMQARAAVEDAQRMLDQLQSKFTQAREELAKKTLATERRVAAYRARFDALASEVVTRRANSYKVPQQVIQSASIPCEDLALSACKVKTQQEVQRRAIEKGAVIVVESITEIRNLTLQKDEVRTEVHGEISNLKILETKLADEPATYYMKIQATVTPVIGDSLLAEIRRTVRADMSLQVRDGGLLDMLNQDAGLAVSRSHPATSIGNQNANAGVAAKVDGVSIPQSRVEFRIKAAMQAGQGDTPELRKAVLDDLINLEVMAQEGVKLGWGTQTAKKQQDDSEAAQQRVLAEQSAIAGVFVRDYVQKHPVSEQAIRVQYELMKMRVGNKEYKVSHILVATEEEAQEVLSQLKHGLFTSFASIAKRKSLDPGSKENGGNLGWSVPSNFVQPFGDALLNLGKGQISAPVKTKYGWHIIRTEDIRNLTVPNFEQMKPKLEKRMQQDAIEKVIADLRDKAKVEYFR